MSGYKLIAFDMDGTLLNSEKKIDDETKKAFSAAVAAGKHIALCTGRGIPELNDYFDELTDVEYAVANSGAIVFDIRQRKAVSQHCLDVETVKHLLDIALTEDTMVHFLFPDRSVTEKHCNCNTAKYCMGQYQPLFSHVSSPVEDIRLFYAENPIPVPKMNIYHQSPEQRERTEKRAAGIDAEMIRAEIASLEFTAKGVSKGTGLSALCSLLGISLSEAIAVGDSDNDIPMLKCAGLGVAMGNASAPAVKAADVQVTDCDHAGCAEAIYKYLLG